MAANRGGIPAHVRRQTWPTSGAAIWAASTATRVCSGRAVTSGLSASKVASLIIRPCFCVDDSCGCRSRLCPGTKVVELLRRQRPKVVGHVPVAEHLSRHALEPTPPLGEEAVLIEAHGWNPVGPEVR